MSLEVRKTVLPDGLAVLSQSLPDRQTVSVGVWIRTGARDEPRERLGIAHFLEHMMFKGTETRDARAIASSLESIGGHHDAFTTREQVCYAARALSEHLEPATDVLADIVCRSRFDPTELEREKSVVKEEILSYEDNPEEKVADHLAELVWGDHALGRPILGTAHTVDGFDQASLRENFRHRYRADQIVVVGAGGLEHEHLVGLVERLFAPPAGDPPATDGAPPAFHARVRHEARDLQQLYLSLGTRGVSYQDPRRYALVVLETLLGGGMSSRLFQSIREDAGLAYSVFSSVDFLRDGGSLSIHLGVSPDRARRALALLREELDRLVRDGATSEEIASAKMQLKGSVVIGQESVSSRMYHIARQELYTRGYLPPEEQVARILSVTSADVLEAARAFARPEQFALAALGPVTDGEALTASDWPVA